MASPTGKRVIPSDGPLDAEIVVVAESPAEEELKQGRPLVGRSGKLLNTVLRQVGLSIEQVYCMNCVPVRAPADKFARHSPDDVAFGRHAFQQELLQLTKAKVFVALGANPTEWLLGFKPPVVQRGEGKGREGFISEWRGSVIPVRDMDGIPDRPEDYLQRLPTGEPPTFGSPNAVIIPTYHPAAILRQFTWHPWFLLDWQKAVKVAKDGVPLTKYRQWYFQDLEALRRLAESDVDLIAVDTELEPAIVSITTEEEVHVFE